MMKNDTDRMCSNRVLHVRKFSNGGVCNVNHIFASSLSNSCSPFSLFTHFSIPNRLYFSLMVYLPFS